MTRASPRSGEPAHPVPSPFVYHALRLFVKALVGGYLRVRVDGVDHLPASGGYLICFNHPSWLDPPVLTAGWPDSRRRLFIFGPREADMTVGLRNRFITWTGRGVPFKPDAADALDAARRAVSVLRAGHALAVAGEGRLSDREGRILPLEPGVAHFARVARVPIVPVAIIGTRWVHFGKTVQLRIGRPVEPWAFGSGRAASRAATAAVEEELGRLLDGVRETVPPGPFGAWLSELYNDRPWLDDPDS